MATGTVDFLEAEAQAGVDLAGLDPTLAKLGVAVGLLRPGSQDGSWSLNTSWFADPISATRDSLTNNGEALADLLGAALGAVGGTALGIPLANTGDLGTWYPILNPTTQKPTGLFLVARTENRQTTFGLGVHYDWPVMGKVAIRAWGVVPVVQVGGGTYHLAIGQAGSPILVGLETVAPEPLVNACGVQVAGMRLTASLSVAPQADASISIVAVGLQLPGETKPKDRALSDLKQLSGAQILSSVSSIFVAAMADGLSEKEKTQLAHLLPVLGLSSVLPPEIQKEFPDASMPLLHWEEMFSAEHPGTSQTEPIRNWFTALLSNSSTARAWLTCVQRLLGLATPQSISGQGTRDNPWSIPVLNSDDGTLSMRIATAVDSSGARTFYPGLSFRSLQKPLTDTAALQTTADLELAQFRLSSAGLDGELADIRFTAGLQLVGATPGKALFEGTIKTIGKGESHYRFGALQAGVRIGSAGGLPKVIPFFTLTDVTTPDAAYPVLDLTQPSQVMNLAEAEAARQIHRALAEIFGVQGTPSHALAVLLGIVPPETKGSAWPLVPPLGEEGLLQSWKDPLAALADYYYKIATAPKKANEPILFTYIVRELATLLQFAAPSDLPTISGSGTHSDPWKAPLMEGGSAHVFAYIAEREQLERCRLVLGIDLGLTLAPKNTKVVLDFAFESLGLDLARSGSTFSATPHILPGLALSLSLPKPYKSPEIAGTSISVGKSRIEARWSRYTGWSWSMEASQPTLSWNKREYPLGQDLVFTQPEALMALVQQQAASFGPILTGILGRAAIRGGDRLGIAIAAILGLLPDAKELCPPDLTWPDDMPTLAVTSFEKPFEILRRQLAGICSKPANLKAALQLLSWAFSKEKAAPAISGSGSRLDPYIAPLGWAAGMGLAVWTDSSAGTAGLGIARQSVLKVDLDDSTSIQFTNQIVARLLNVNLASGEPAKADGVPGISLSSRISSSSGHLLDVKGGPSLDSILVGLEVTLGGSLSEPNWIANPRILLFNLKLPDQNPLSAVDLVHPEKVAAQIAQDAFQAALQPVLKRAMDLPEVDRLYKVLTAIGLTLPADQNPGINPAGWRALLADPTRFVSRNLLALAPNPATRAELFALLREWTGVKSPQLPDSVLELLAALRLVTPQSAGYVPIPVALLQFFAHPAQYLRDRFTTLIADRDRLATLLATLQQTTGIDDLGPFRVQILSGPVVQIGLAAILASESLSVSGNLIVSLNPGAENFRLSLNLKSTQLGIGLESALNASRSGNTSFQQFLTFGDGSMPSPRPLQVWPFDSGAFVKALAEVAPFWALSALISQVIDPQLLQPPPGTVDPELKRYQLAQVLFSILGIAVEDSKGTWHTKSLLGLFDDPVKWLLSDAILGSDDRLNIERLRLLLEDVREFSNSQLTLERIEKGIRLAGLPYGFAITLVADPDAQRVVLTPSLGKAVKTAGGAASLKALSFSLSLGPDCQPGFSGAIAIEIANPAINVTAGYEKEFFLRAAFGNAERKLQLVPFQGWQSFLPEIKTIAVQKLLPELGALLLEGLKQSGSAEAVEFAKALQAAAEKLEINKLIADLLGAGKQEDELQRRAFDWLVQRLATTESAKAVMEVLKPILPRGLSIDGQRIAYAPFSNYPLHLYIGAKANKLGLWASLDALGKSGPLTIRLAETGIAIPYDSGSSASPIFSLGLSLAVPLRGETAMPMLTVAMENGRIAAEFDPLSDEQKKSDLCLELLPTLRPRPKPGAFSGSKDMSMGDWVLRVIEQAAPRYLALIALRQQDIRKWLDAPVFGARSPLKMGALLSDAGLLTPSFALRPISELPSVSSFLGGMLKAMMRSEIRILEFGDKGDVWIGPGPNPATDLGIRMAVRNLRLSSDSNFAFHLGAEDSKWIEDAGGPSLRAGIGVYLPIGANHIPQFGGLKLQLVNVGVDVAGTHGEPLVNMSRFRLDAVKPRGVLIFDFANGVAPTVWGAAVTAEKIGVSLAPNSIGSGGNPVAQNLLGSGTSDSSAGKANQAANPPFSFRAGYLKNGGQEKSVVELIHDHEIAQELWFPLQSQFGPVHVNMLGVKWKAPHTAGVGFDGDVSLAGLTLALQKLTLSFDVFAPTDYSQYKLDLAGINLSFNNGPVGISGAFLKQTEPVLQYMGAARMRCSSFTLQALGSYGVAPVNATAPNGPKAASLFIFAALHTPLGGPPAFYVTGVAAGFGYNRDLTIPSISEIQSFPLVAAASDPKFFPSGEPTKVLERIAGVVPPHVGTYWIAAGVQFTSFELLHTVALLFVRFGQSFEMNLVGLSFASLPPKSPDTLAYLELGILASFKPAAGFISVQAQLTPNSYLLSPSCKLAGGFAFVLWFNGDFVVTLGGYHPMFKVPPSYPSVPRLGFNWPMQISPGSLKVAGTAYFALTPTAIMAGGYLRVAYDLGPIRAWLNSSADFLIQWKPFYYDIAVSISVGVEFHTSFLGVSITLSASLGASLHVWGPETAGSVDVDWYVVSFTIPIGSQQKNLQRNPLGSWDDFAKAFLPPAKDGALLQAADQPPGAVLKLSATEGAVTGPAGRGSNQQANAWAVNLSKWQLRIGTAVPATSVSFNGGEPTAGQPMGVRPMNVSSVTTPLDVRLKPWDSALKKFVDSKISSEGTVIFSLLSSDAPTALWGKGAMNLNAPPVQPFLIGSVCVGATITGQDFTYFDPVGPIPLEKAFEFTEAEKHIFPSPPKVTAPRANAQSGALASLKATIMAPEVIEMRAAVLAAINRAGIQTTPNPQLQVMAAFADAIFQAPPVLAPLGIDVSAKAAAMLSEAGDAVPKVLTRALPEPAEFLNLVGGIHRYCSPEAVTPMLRLSPNDRSLRLPLPRRTGRWVGQTRAGASSPGLQALRARKAVNSNVVFQSAQVAPGSSLLFRMKVNSTTQAVAEIAGDIPVRLWQLNEFDEIIAQELAHSGSRVELLADVTHLAVQGEALRDRIGPNVAVGWQRNSLLTQAGRYTFLADGCVVRPQATPLRMQGRRPITQGVLDGECLLRGNQTDLGGMSFPGWTETMLDGSLIASRGSVAIALRGIGEEAAADVSVGLVWTGDPWQAVYETTVRPTEVLRATDGCILIFPAPAAKKGTPAQWLAVLVEGSQQYALEGVWGVAGAAKKMSGLWPKLTGLAVGIEPNRDENEWSTVSVSLHEKSSVAAKGGNR